MSSNGLCFKKCKQKFEESVLPLSRPAEGNTKYQGRYKAKGEKLAFMLCFFDDSDQNENAAGRAAAALSAKKSFRDQNWWFARCYGLQKPVF